MIDRDFIYDKYISENPADAEVIRYIKDNPKAYEAYLGRMKQAPEHKEMFEALRMGYRRDELSHLIRSLLANMTIEDRSHNSRLSHEIIEAITTSYEVVPLHGDPDLLIFHDIRQREGKTP